MLSAPESGDAFTVRTPQVALTHDIIVRAALGI